MAGLIAPDDLFGDVIFSYSLEDALSDGVLAKLWEEKWPYLSDGNPIVATKAITETLTNEQLVDTWNAFVHWQKRIKPLLREEDRLFTRRVAGETVWVMEDGTTYTLLFPEDY